MQRLNESVKNVGEALLSISDFRKDFEKVFIKKKQNSDDFFLV